jgi:hypothetical protein
VRNDPLAQKFLLDKQISYEEIYFKSFQAIIHDTPVFFRPLILRHWINVSSDLWKDGLGNKMLDICKEILNKHVPQYKENLIGPNKVNFDIFCEKRAVKEITDALTSLEQDLKEIIKNGRIEDKEVLYDIQSR